MAAERERILMCGHTFLYSPPVRAIKRMISEDKLGDIYFISSSRVNLGLHQRDVSVIWDLAPHDFSILLYWLSEMPTSVRAIGRDSIVKGIADVAFVTLTFALRDHRQHRAQLAGAEQAPPHRAGRLGAHGDLRRWGAGAGAAVRPRRRLPRPGDVWRVPPVVPQRRRDLAPGSNPTSRWASKWPISSARSAPGRRMEYHTAIARSVVRLVDAADRSLREGGREIAVEQDVSESHLMAARRPGGPVMSGSAERAAVHPLPCARGVGVTSVPAPASGRSPTCWRGAVIGADCNICDHSYIDEDVVIGDRVTIKGQLAIIDGMRIEDDVFIGPNATFTNDRFPRSRQQSWQCETMVIGRGASIGAGAIFVPGVSVGEGAMVGAGAVVTKDVPPFTVVVGNPARVVREVADAERVPIRPLIDHAKRRGAVDRRHNVRHRDASAEGSERCETSGLLSRRPIARSAIGAGSWPSANSRRAAEASDDRTGRISSLGSTGDRLRPRWPRKICALPGVD